MASYAHESITVANTAIGFTAARITGAGVFSVPLKRVTCTLESAQIRFTVDGTTPTTSVGHILNPGDILIVGAGDAAAFRAIRTGSVSGTLKCTYEV